MYTQRISIVSYFLEQDYLACSSDLQEVLQQDPNVQEAEKELEEVTVLLRQSLANASPTKHRKTVPITEVNTLFKNDEYDNQGCRHDFGLVVIVRMTHFVGF